MTRPYGSTASGENLPKSSRKQRGVSDGARRTRRPARKIAAPSTEHKVAQGLTRREYEVLREASSGLSNAEIGKVLLISAGTVRRHFENIFAKLGVHNRVAALQAMAQRTHVHSKFWNSVDDQG